VAADPVVGVDELPQSAVLMDVEVVPHENDGCAELLVFGVHGRYPLIVDTLIIGS
jgi:hypothetical protein